MNPFIRTTLYSAVTAVALAVMLLFASGAPAVAQAQSSTEPTREELLVQIQQLIVVLMVLKEQLESQNNASLTQSTDTPVVLQPHANFYAEQTDADDSGRTSVSFESPRNNSSYRWTGEVEDFKIEWEAENVPDDANLRYEHEVLELFSGAVGGGAGSSELPVGDSEGYVINTYGPGYQSPGKYRMRLSVESCHSQGCNVNPRFPGQEEDIEIYATTEWRYYTIGDHDAEVYETNGAVTIEDIRPTSGTIYFDEPTTVSFGLEGVPQGAHLTCFYPENKASGAPYNIGGNACRPAQNGTLTWEWTPEDWMPAGEYRLRVYVYDEDDGSGKDLGQLAYRRADWFTLTYDDDRNSVSSSERQSLRTDIDEVAARLLEYQLEYDYPVGQTSLTGSVTDIDIVLLRLTGALIDVERYYETGDYSRIPRTLDYIDELFDELEEVIAAS